MNELNAITETNTNATTTADDRELYYAQPYGDGAGFYFTDHSAFCAQLQVSRHEEFELQCLSGVDCELFKACGVDMSNLTLWFDCVQELEDYERVALFYRCDDLAEDLEFALDNLEDTRISEGTAKDYAEELVEDCGMLDGMPEILRCYFDMEAFARDMQRNGELTEFMYNGSRYVATQ
jgi:hypothetical protein